MKSPSKMPFSLNQSQLEADVPFPIATAFDISHRARQDSQNSRKREPLPDLQTSSTRSLADTISNM